MQEKAFYSPLEVDRYRLIDVCVCVCAPGPTIVVRSRGFFYTVVSNVTLRRKIPNYQNDVATYV